MFKSHAALSLKLTEDAEDDIDERVVKINKLIKSECVDAKQKLEEYSIHIDKYSAAQCTSDTLTRVLCSIHSTKLK